MSTEPIFEPDRLVAAFNAAQIEYVIVGGLAYMHSEVNTRSREC